MKKKYLLVAAGCMIVAAVSGECGRRRGVEMSCVVVEERRDTLVVRDTVVVARPVEVARRIVDTVVVSLPSAAVPTDSVAVALNRTQAVYADSNYVAWVSGWEPRLDSLHLRRVTREITHTATSVYRPPRWCVGLSAGVGVDPKGRVTPYVGVGISYSLFSLGR